MLITDENISEAEIWRLREGGTRLRTISDVAIKSIQDDNIVSLLHRLKLPTLFTKDKHYWKYSLVHSGYCLVYLDVPEHEGRIATFIRRFLHHHHFNTHSKRMGKVVRLHVRGIEFFEKGTRKSHAISWMT